jgi:hypothetical protein
MKARESIAASWRASSRDTIGAFAAALWGLIGEGYLCPIFGGGGGSPVGVEAVALTDRGRRMILAANVHPAHPRFLSRLTDAGVNESVIARLEDARACLDRLLLRPAAVMVGLAFEETLELSTRQAEIKGMKRPAGKIVQARERLASLRAFLPYLGLDAEAKDATDAALAAAAFVRELRNRASHPLGAFDDAEAVEATFAFAPHHLMALWKGFEIPAGERLPE